MPGFTATSRRRPARRPERALIVDLRSADERLRDGVVPGSLHVPRTFSSGAPTLEARGTTRASAASVAG